MRVPATTPEMFPGLLGALTSAATAQRGAPGGSGEPFPRHVRQRRGAWPVLLRRRDAARDAGVLLDRRPERDGSQGRRAPPRRDDNGRRRPDVGGVVESLGAYVRFV